MTVQSEPERLSFQAEATQILDLVINSLYSNKEIFLRELISNASDAIGRLRLELLAQSLVPEEHGPFQIRVSFDADAGTITVSDNGIGMSRQEVIDNIGTIAKSGTREALRALSGDRSPDAAPIGQFGVGFYSAFIVAEKVTLVTRRAGSPAVDGTRWESDGRGMYSLEAMDCPDRGTTIVLHLREGEDDLLSAYRLRSIIQKYSDHISLPILMPGEEAPDLERSGEQSGSQLTRVNQASAPWARPKSELTNQDYVTFYRHITGDYGDPIAYLHSKIEGNYEYTLLLFIPAPSASHGQWSPQPGQGIRLHVQRVFIMADTGQLMPQYLRFVRGVIDSSELPLNVSRELLQGSRIVEIIRANAVKKVLKMLADLAEREPEKYAAFWKEFGPVLKEGVADDYSNRDDIARLLRFTSTASAGEEQDVSLSAYVSRMKEEQESIYYLLAPSRITAANSPHLEAPRKKGMEVLLLTDGVDDWVVTSMQEFDGRRLQSVAQGATEFGPPADEAEQEAVRKASEEFAGLTGRLKEILEDEVRDVRISSRLTDSPSCIVTGESDLQLLMDRWLSASGRPAQSVLEINPQHPLVERLRDRLQDPQLADWAHVLYNQAVLTLGGNVDNPAAFVRQLNGLLVNRVQTDDEVQEEAAPTL